METNEVTERVIGCAMNVSNILGPGFLEKVYENAMVHEVRKAGLAVTTQRSIAVTYDGVIVGNYVADLIVEDQVIIEVKGVRAIDTAHEAQLLNYLKATGIRVGLILNFGTARLGIKRMIR